MKNRIFLLFCLCALFAAAAQAASRFVVTIVKGKVTYMTDQGQRLPLETGDLMDETTVVNIPFHGALEFADESAQKKYNITTPGRAPVSVLLKDKRNNTVETLTRNYVKSVVGQVTGSSKIKAEIVTQPACITRKMETVKKKGLDMDVDFDLSLDAEFDMDNLDMSFSKQDLINDYMNFRKQCVATYVGYLRETWKSYSGEDPVKRPQEKELPPLIIPVDENGNEGEPVSYDREKAEALKGEVASNDNATSSWLSYLGGLLKNVVKKVTKKKADRQLAISEVHRKPAEDKPKEVKAPVPVAPLPASGGGVQTLFRFTSFGTEFQVRVGDDCRFELRSTDEETVANAIQKMTDTRYDNLLYDCLAIRKTYRLSDWAYYEVLRDFCEEFCGSGTNEATLLLGYLYSQSGYKLRLGRGAGKLVLLLASQHTIYDKMAYRMDGDRFYLLDSESSVLEISRASFPNETGLSLAIANSQKFALEQSEVRTIQSEKFPDFKVTLHINKNLINFYKTYLSSTINNDEMSLWAFYANAPMADDVKAELYPQLHEQLDGLSQEDAVARLLDLIQRGMPYEYDDIIWHCERIFFAEETLFYPYCDCEDRAILLSRLVRDILGLKTVLVYYPGHLAMGVHFTEPVQGDYILVDGEKFTVCDPTYIAVSPGVSMPTVDKSKAKAILLK